METLQIELRKLNPKFKLTLIGLGRQLRKIQFNLKNAGIQLEIVKLHGMRKIRMLNHEFSKNPKVSVHPAPNELSDLELI